MMLISRRGRFIAICTLAFAACCSLTAFPSRAAAEERAFEISAGHAENTLKEFGRQAQLQTLFDYRLVQNLQTQAVRGDLEPEAALTQMLAGTGLVFERINDRTVAICSAKHGDGGCSAKKISAGRSGDDNRPLVLAQAQSASPTTEETAKPAENGAAPALEEIVVTAQKREERIQDVPASITALSGDFLTQSGVDALDELSRVVPGLGVNLEAAGNLGKFGSVAIRGIGTVTFSQAQDPSVAIVKDGVVLGQTGTAFTDYDDIERIEVLRGPQGTLFGMNASAGVINIVTKNPTQEFSGDMGVSYGSYNEVRVHGAVSGPIAGDTLLGRLSFHAGNQDGYLTNIFVPNSKEGRDEQRGVGGKLLFLPRDETRIALNFDWTEREGRGTRNAPRLVTPLATPGDQALNGPFASETNATSTATGRRGADVRNRGVSLQWDETLGDHTLTSITAWRDRYHTHDVDPLSVPNQLLVIVDAPLDQYQVSEELRIASPTGGLVDYVAGLFAFKQQVKESVFIDVDLRPTGDPIDIVLDSDVTIDSLNTAVFGDLNFHVTDTLTLIAGTRWTRDKREMHLVGLPRPVIPGVLVIPLLTPPGTTDDSVTATNWSWRGGVRWEPNQDHMLYATAARGFKGPGFNSQSGLLGVSQRVDPEISTSYELGWKAALWGNRVRPNVALFFAQFDDFQAQGNELITLPNGQPLSNFVLANVGKLETKGAEFELETVPLENLRINFNAAYINAEVKEFPNAPCYFAQSVAQGCVDGVQDLAGAPLPSTPEWSFNVSGSYDFSIAAMPFDGFVRADYSWRDEVLWSISQDPLTVEDAYGLLGASFGIRDKNDRYTLRVFGKNLTDKFHATGIEGATLYVHHIPTDYRRIFGIAFDYQF